MAQNKNNSINKINIELDETVEKTEIIKDNFKGKLAGYSMSHTFRGKNDIGALVKSKQIFYFNKDLTEITNIE